MYRIKKGVTYMYTIKPYDKTTGNIYKCKIMVTGDLEQAQWIQAQYNARGIGCVVRNTETGAEW